MTGKHLAKEAVAQLAFFILVASIAFPFYYLIVNSLKTVPEYTNDSLGLPENVSFAKYAEILGGEDSVGTWYLNSVILTASAVLITVILALAPAYAFARMRFFGRKALFRLMIATIAIPPMVLVLPVFKLAVDLGIVGSRATAILVYVGLLMPFSIFMLASFMRDIPQSYIDASRIDGAGTGRILAHVVMPLARPAILALCLVNGVWVWNELIIPLVFLQDESLRTITVGVTLFQGRFQTDVPSVMAGLVLVLWVPVVVYIFAQRYLRRGLVAGGLKG